MEYRRLGNTGLRVSALALQISDASVEIMGRARLRECVAQALDGGIHLLAAEGEQGQAMLGDVLADLRIDPARRCLLASVQGAASQQAHPLQQGLSRKSLRSFCESSLRRLHADYLDLLLCHRPDPHTPLHETVAALDQLIRVGKLLHWGVSEWPTEAIAQAIEMAHARGWSAPSFEQVSQAGSASSDLGVLLRLPELRLPESTSGAEAAALQDLLQRQPQVASLILEARPGQRFEQG